MKVKIEAIKQTIYQDLIEQYEIPNPNACHLHVGDVFYVDYKLEKPERMCDSFWKTVKPFCDNLLNSKDRIYGKWMKNNDSYLISCDDGFRPMSFLITLE